MSCQQVRIRVGKVWAWHPRSAALCAVLLIAFLGLVLPAVTDAAPAPTCELASVRSSASGVITAVLKKCGPGTVVVKTSPAYAKEYKRQLNSVSSLTIHLSPDGKGKALLRKKKHPHVKLQLSLHVTSGPQAGSVVIHTATATIGINGSQPAEEKKAAQQQAKEEAKGTQGAEAASKKKAEEEAAAKKKAEEEAAVKKKAEEEAAAKAAATKDETEAKADKKAAATDESEAVKLLGEATGSEKAANEQSAQAAELEGEAKSFEARATKDKETAEFYKEEAESAKDNQGNDESEANQLENEAQGAEQAVGGAEQLCAIEEAERCPEAESDEAQARGDHASAGTYDSDAVKEREAAEKYEGMIAPEEELAAEEANEGAFLAGHAQGSREFQKDDETAATADKANASKKEHEAPAAKKLAEQKEKEAASELHAAEVAEKA
jgi:hypothetical protein